MNDYPEAYISFLVEFHATRDFFECHELLEEYWKEHQDDGLSELWVGLIGVAVAQYHERRGNRSGAFKSYEHAEGRLAQGGLEKLGIDGPDLLRQMAERKRAAHGGAPYADITMAISDEALMARCLRSCRERGLRWGAASPMNDDSLIHRHKLRDRSEVIAARSEALQQKRRAENMPNDGS